MAEYDQITRDLARKAGDDACAAVYRTMGLTDDPSSKTLIAIMAASQVIGIPAGALAAKLGTCPEVVADALWSRIRPIILSSVRNLAGES